MKSLSAILLTALIAFSASAQVRITEFMASNTQTLTDEDGDSSDWIELQNTSSNSFSLLNWALRHRHATHDGQRWSPRMRRFII